MPQEPGLLRKTLPTAQAVAAQRWFDIVVVIGAGFAAGALSTTFSALTSRLFAGVDSLISNHDPLDSLAAPLPRSLTELRGVAGYIQAIVAPIPATPLNDIGLALAFLLLLVVVNYMSARSRNAVESELYVALRRQAFQRCFEADRGAVLDEDGQAISGQDTSNRLSTALNRGAGAVADLYALFLNLGQQVTALVVAIASAAGGYWPITVACAAIIVVQLGISLWLAQRLKVMRETSDREINGLQGKTANWLDNRELILIFDKGEVYQEKLDRLTRDLTARRRKIFNVEEFANQLQRFTRDGGQVLVVLFAAFATIQLLVPSSTGTERMTYFAVTLYGSLLGSARSLISNFDNVRRTSALSKSYLRIIDDDPNGAADYRPATWTRGQPIAIAGLGFRYPKAARPVFERLDLAIPGGKTTVILGPSGCGKTSMGKMILGLMTPSAGTIQVGGQEIRQWRPDVLRAEMSYVPQQDHVLDETVEANLRLAELSSAPFSREKLLNALDQVGLGTVLGPDPLALNAQQLAGGQMQRVAAARTILDDADILVLDEPMAGVDSFTLADIAPVLGQRWQSGRQTVVLISHKLVFTSIADNIVILGADGRILDQGSPAHLAQHSAHFQALLQTALDQVQAPGGSLPKAPGRPGARSPKPHGPASGGAAA